MKMSNPLRILTIALCATVAAFGVTQATRASESLQRQDETVRERDSKLVHKHPDGAARAGATHKGKAL